MKPEPQTFTTIIQTNPNYKNSAYVDIPFDVEKVYGKKRVKIKAIFDDKVSYRGSLVRMGSPDHMLILRKDVRSALGKTVGDTVKVSLEEDTEERKVEMPKDFQLALSQQKELEDFYKRLSYTHQREYVEWIIAAKKPETRLRRINKVLEMMSQGKKGR